MIYELCNLNHEQIETFNLAAVIKKSSLSNFNHLSSDDAVETIITNLPDSASAFIVGLLPDDYFLTPRTVTNDQGKYFNVQCRFTLTPLDKNLQALLDGYNNEEVVLLLSKFGSSFLYGTAENPLVMVYNPIHNNRNEGLKGYEINISGSGLGAERQFEEVSFNIFNRGLAFTLAQGI